ncbi:MAG: carbohydrate ABC transporter permease [Eubacteriales bacterium]|nr:carbohydrate ABC transporter permease [Eubacteriales bacterium]
MKRKRKKAAKQVMIYVLAFALCIYVLAPYAWLIISSISTKTDLLSKPLRWLPRKPTLENYLKIFLGTSGGTTSAANQFKYALGNSFLIAVVVTIIALAAGVLAAYAFARFNFRLKKSLFYSVIITQMVPPVALLIPMYIIYLRMDLTDSKTGLIIIYLSMTLPFVIWIMKGYLTNLPMDLEDAARVDGCSQMQAFFKIVLPLSGPGLASTAIFIFIMAWNEFFYAVNLTSSMTAKTVPVLITEFSSKAGYDFIMAATGGVLASIPPVVLSLVFQKFIVSGLTAGAVKS